MCAWPTPHSPNDLEDVFSELLLYRVLGSSPFPSASGGQTVMNVRGDAVVLFARLLHRIHVDDSRVEVA